MEWNSLNPGILSQACGLDLPTCSGCIFQKNLNTTYQKVSYELRVRMDIVLLRKSTQSCAFWNLLYILQCYSIFKALFIITPSHSPFSCLVPKKLQFILHPLVNLGYLHKKYMALEPVNWPTHPSNHTQCWAGLIPWFDNHCQCFMKQCCTNNISCSLSSKK
jgi:hypothetical protein